ncbi:SDR family oxidoreductase [Pseudomonas sp. 15FMM2]|uniref:SDR family oxidoreductase n=1 Tax=Pseudomonas imrae TaxID=2992837 RepID=A0ACC7P6P8_9PSED
MKRKWIFVTGGSRGIGAEIVRSASRNYDVVFTYKTSMIEAKALAEQLNNEPGNRVEAVHCDVSDVSQVEDVAQSLIQRYGPPYAVINNAGVAEDSLFSNLDEQALTHIFSQNVFSAFSVSRAFIGSMMGESDACIINISSVSGIKGNVGQSAYSATKAALIGMTRSLALEMSRFNMRVNSIAPGYIETDMTRHLKDSGTGLKKSIPLRRFGSTVEVASLVDYLLSEGAAYITGQTLVIDGGLTC